MDKENGKVPESNNEKQDLIRSRERIRHRAKIRYRCYMGVYSTLAKKWKLIYIIIWAIGLTVTLKMAGTFTEFILGNWLFSVFNDWIANIAERQIIYEIVIALTTLLFLLILVGILYLLGIPFHAKQIEDDLAAALVTSKNYYKRPFLIKAMRVGNSDFVDCSFYSRWLSVEDYQKPGVESKILTAMQCSRVEGYRFKNRRFRKGKNRKIIVIRLGIYEKPPERENLYDEEL